MTYHVALVLIIDVIASDCGSPGAERRVAVDVLRGDHRLVVLEVSGGTMDIGWAHRAIEWLRTPCRTFTQSARPPSIAAGQLRRDLQSTLDRVEREERCFASVQFLALDVSALAEGRSRVFVARIGGMRMWICGAHPARIVGREDVCAMSAGDDGITRPILVTACLRPTHRWSVVDDEEGLHLVDETNAAVQCASAYREETFDIDDPKDVALVVMNDDGWAGEDPVEIPRGATHAEIAGALEARIDRTADRNVIAAVIQARFPA